MEQIVRHGLRVLVVVVLLCLFGISASGQDVEDYYARMLEEEVEVVNPVKRPVISLGAGVVNFLGEIQYPGGFWTNSTFGARVNVSTLLGKSKQVKMNVFVMYGQVQGMDWDRSVTMNRTKLPRINDVVYYPSTAFKTDFYEIGFSGEYNFWHLIGIRKLVRPYVSLGAGLLIFTPKGNLQNEKGEFYHYWKDGTLRNASEDGWTGAVAPLPERMDKFFETDLKRTNLYGLSSFPPVSAVFPFELGVDFYLSERLNLRVFSALHYTLTDLMDGYSPAVAKLYSQQASKVHDMFVYTGLAFHMDLFSQAESFIVDRVFADLEDFDYEVFFADQDGDGVFDHLDNCADTPEGVEVDSVGCPYDVDKDGVPDYRDDELNTPINIPAGDSGRALQDGSMSLPRLPAPPVERSRMRTIPLSTSWVRRYQFASGAIPSKFSAVDLDGDKYIAFDEVIRAVDDFFTGKSEYSPDDIYELNAFFFAQ